jgi:hypothetical protein
VKHLCTQSTFQPKGVLDPIGARGQVLMSQQCHPFIAYRFYSFQLPPPCLCPLLPRRQPPLCPTLILGSLSTTDPCHPEAHHLSSVNAARRPTSRRLAGGDCRSASLACHRRNGGFIRKSDAIKIGRRISRIQNIVGIADLRTSYATFILLAGMKLIIDA